MRDEHLDTIPATESDEVIKSSVEDLVIIPSESEGIPDTMCDLHLVNNPTPLEAKDYFEVVINSNDDYSSSDDDSLYYENIQYVKASPHDYELVSLEVEKIVIPEDEEIEDDNLCEKLLKVNLLIAKIEALKDNSTPSFEFLTKSSSTSPKSVLEETNIFDDSLPEFENFCFDLEEISSGSTTTHSDMNLPDLGEWISSLNFGIRENLSSITRVNLPVEDDHSLLLAYVLWIFLAYLTLLNKKCKNLNDDPKSNDTMKYPPGFTPMTNVDSQSNDLKGVGKEGDETLKNDQEEKQNSEVNGFLTVWKRSLGAVVLLRGVINRYLSDHRPILLREYHVDYGPIPFRFFHYWFEMVGFDEFVEITWSEIQTTDTNDILKFMKKMKCLKENIQDWIKIKNENSYIQKKNLKEDLAEIDLLLDKGKRDYDILNKRVYVSKSLQDIGKLESMKVAQKAKIKWAIEGDENSKYYHGILNKKRSQLVVRGILVNGTWIDSPCLVKNEFLSHFKSCFDQPGVSRLHLNIEFHNKLTMDQKTDLECDITRDEIKRAIWTAGLISLLVQTDFLLAFIVDTVIFWRKTWSRPLDIFFSMGLFLKAVIHLLLL
nr:RNA-directed DNA polymerase, eukaryota, reverse transcriptase zinc-binding domain protein [Tanacetum cinerariifolium]